MVIGSDKHLICTSLGSAVFDGVETLLILLTLHMGEDWPWSLEFYTNYSGRGGRKTILRRGRGEQVR